MDKPLIIMLNDTKMEMVSVINNAIQNNSLPFYLIEPIMSELLAQIREGAKNELQVAREQMAQASGPEE